MAQLWKRAGLITQRFPGSNPGPAPVRIAQLVERRYDTAEVGGSIPSLDTGSSTNAGHLTFDQADAGSSPVGPIHSLVAKRQGVRLLIGISQVRFLSRERMPV
jgi:hypothetical protein